MIRGTTPTNRFYMDIDLSSAKVYLTYAQGGNVVFEKTGDDLIFASEAVDDETQYIMSANLTQEDTLALKSDKQVRIQIRAVFVDGKSVASEIMEVTVGDILKDGEIEYEP